MSDRLFFGEINPEDRTKFQRPTAQAESIGFSELLQETQKKYEKADLDLERNRKLRSIVVPTNDELVKLKLRELNHPICLFGEGPAERRTRLKGLMVELGIEQGLPNVIPERLRGETEREEEREVQDEIFFTESPDPEKLIRARLWIANYSLPRSRARIVEQKERQAALQQKAKLFHQITQSDVDTDPALKLLSQEMTDKRKLFGDLGQFTVCSSQVADRRPLSNACLSKDSSLVLTAGWSGKCNVWNSSSCSNVSSFEAHSDRVTHAVFHPDVSLSNPSSLSFASAGSEGLIKLWALDKTTEPLGKMKGHVEKVSQIDFHPSGKFLGSASHDLTWRLWDLDTQSELLLQEGHCRPITCIRFHPDGSLAATGGVDCCSFVWDLRTGRSIGLLKGHVKQVLSIDFSPNGYHVATASDDHTVRIWDLRKQSTCIYTIPAHNALVSSVRYEKNGGRFLVSSSFDKTIKIWDAKSFTALRVLSGHENKIMSVDVSHDSSFLVSSAFDSSWKVWSKENL